MTRKRSSVKPNSGIAPGNTALRTWRLSARSLSSTLECMRNAGVSLGLVMSAAVVCALASGCGDNPPRAPSGEGGAPPPSAWRAAVGSSGTLVQTFDDRVWTSRVVSGVDLFGVACVGNLEGWAAGAGGFIAHTGDGGSTWSVQNSTTNAALRAIRFRDVLHGVAVGDGGTLLTTGDGGTTWHAQTTGVMGALRGIALGGHLVLAVGDAGVVVRSNDDGKTLMALVLEDAGDLRGIAMDPGAHLALAVSASGAVFASTDGGAHWSRETTAPAPLDAVALRDDGMRALAAGADGLALARDARGAWSTLRTNTVAYLHAALLEGDRAYVAGEEGTILEAATVETGFVPVVSRTRATLWALEDL